MQGDYLQHTQFDSIIKAREFKKSYDNSNSPIYGMERFAYQYIANEYKDDVEWQKDKIKIFTIDIETSCEEGFPDVDNPVEEILCLTVKNQTNKQIITWGTGEFKTDREDVTYIRCNSEKEIIKEFMTFWMRNYPDIITGWNCKFFDIPYLMNRINRLTDDKVVRNFSPWKYVEKKEIVVRGRPKTVFSIMGIAMLDYIDLYQKFIPVSQESYKLDYIGKVELGVGKDEMPYETFREWYTKDFQSFVDYNIQDVEIVDKLEDKLKLIELILTMAYEAKVNYDDVFSQVRVWDVLIYNFLRKEHIVVPEKSEKIKDSKYDGAYVKDPITGMHKWIVSFDINSLYPHLIMQYNISPEKIVGIDTNSVTVNKLLAKKPNLEHLKSANLCMTPNGARFKRDNAGFLPRLLDKYIGMADIVFDNMIGEPTLEMEKLITIGRSIKERRHGVPLTINTNGLSGSAGAEQLFEMDPGDNTGLKNLHLSVLLPANNPPKYNKLMKNTDPSSFGQVCSFLVSAIELLGGEYVTCMAIDAPGADINGIRALIVS